MRVRRLDLLRYGCFTDVLLELPANNPDIHIFFGSNEAGKSSALSAIEDLLFSIPHNSSLNFLHDYASMRIGAILEKDGEYLEMRRRKGNKDTLLTAEESPMLAGEGTLGPLLGDADRTFFARMFSLGHERLRQGGLEIVMGRDDVGQMLFAAGTGITGLRERLKALEKEADGLWAPRAAAHRKYYQIKDQLKAAEDALREHTVTARKWQDVRREWEATQRADESLKKDVEEKSTEARKVRRIRRVYRHVQRKSELDVEIDGVGEVSQLPEDAFETLETAKRDDEKTLTRIETLSEQLDAVREERVELTYDKALLQRGDDIKKLHEQRIEVRAGKADLPKRRAELASAEAELRRLAHDLEWEEPDLDALVAYIPARFKVTVVRTLLNRRGQERLAVENAEIALEESTTKLGEITEQLDEMSVSPDISKLGAIIKATREIGDIKSRVTAADREEMDSKAIIESRLGVLHPSVESEEMLGAMHVPPRDTVQSHRDARRELDQQRRSYTDQVRAAKQELSRLQKAYERVTRDEDAVGPDELAGAREHRDAGWSLIRCRYVENVSVPDEDVCLFTPSNTGLADAFEAAMRDADEVADRRFKNADAEALLAVISRQIDEQQELLEDLLRDEKALSKQSETLDADWEELWKGTKLMPLLPDYMLEWMTARTEVLTCVERRDGAQRQAAALRREESEAKNALLAEIEMLGVKSGSLKDQPLRVVLEAATEAQRCNEQNAETRHQFEENLRNARADKKRKSDALKKSKLKWSEWECQWADALHGLGLGTSSDPEGVASQIDSIESMREILVRVNELRHERIGKIDRDVVAFGLEVDQVVGLVATDLTEVKPDDAVLELERRLEETTRNMKLQTEKDGEIASIEGKIVKCEEARRDVAEIILGLLESAGVDDVDKLRMEIERSDSLRELQKELSQVRGNLAEDSDGLSVAQLEQECQTVNLDQIAAREEALDQELDDLRERHMEARERRKDVGRKFEAIGGDGAAAVAAFHREVALADMQEVAGQYVRARTAALLVQWGIDRYRREKQAPLLKRAGQLFARVTCGSFSDVRLEFDEKDQIHLTGIRSDGSKVGVDGMSDGTVDQLYLALRVASVEDYLERANPLPFVADDLFVNFDDVRATAGLEILGELARKTQVLFFTHHSHLLDLARSTLGGSVAVISLPHVDSRIDTAV